MNNAHQNADTQLIERIVREVVSRLRNENEQMAQNGNSVKPENLAGTLSLGENVISAESLKGKLNKNVSRLRLQPKAVLTPTARDELRDHGVEIIFDQTVAASAGQPDLVFATTNEPNPQFLDRLTRSGIKIQLKHDTCVRRLVAGLTGRFSTSARLMVFVDQPYTASCVANRNPSVRAAVVRDESELKIVRKEINPNVIVVPADCASILDTVAKELVS